MFELPCWRKLLFMCGSLGMLSLVPKWRLFYCFLCLFSCLRPSVPSSLRDPFSLARYLAYLNNLYIHFRFDVGLYFQYFTIHEQCFEVGGESERPYSSVQEGVGIHSITLKANTIDGGATGSVPQWVCDVEIPDGTGDNPPAISRTHLPHYRGTRMRLVFREDHSSWFF